MSIYQRGENWYIDFTFKGQRIRESIGPSRKGAEKVITKKKAEIAENKFLDVRKDPDPIKFHDFGKEYLQWKKVNRKPSSYSRNLSQMRMLEKHLNVKNLSDLTAWDIEKWQSKRRKTLAAATVNRDLALLKHMFTKAIEWGKVKSNPAKTVKFLKGEVKRVRFLLPEEIQKLLSECDERIKPLLTVKIHTGMRRSEIVYLKKNQVDLRQGMITLLDTKNGERRDIPMNETVRSIISGLMQFEGEYVFTDRDGKVFGFTTLQDLFGKAIKAAGIEDFRLHDCRHCFASNLVMAGEDLNTVAELLGHKKLEMTRRYAHLSPSHKRRAVNVLDRIMSQNPPQAEEAKKVVHLNR